MGIVCTFGCCRHSQITSKKELNLLRASPCLGQTNSPTDCEGRFHIGTAAAATLAIHTPRVTHMFPFRDTPPDGGRRKELCSSTKSRTDAGRRSSNDRHQMDKKLTAQFHEIPFQREPIPNRAGRQFNRHKAKTGEEFRPIFLQTFGLKVGPECRGGLQSLLFCT